MNTGKVKISLSLSRGTQTPTKEDSKKSRITDDENMNISCLDAALNSPIARPSRLSSTPIQKNVELCEDSPDQDYRGSPTSLYPCTQESGNEISWDWEGKGARKPSDSTSGNVTGRNNGALNYTPKRPHLLQKKRLAKSNSPLLNIPSKRKIVDLEVAERIGKFAAELEALADEIKTGRNCSNEKKTSDQIASTSSNNKLNIFEMPTQKVFDIHEASTMEFGDKTQTEKTDSSLDDMFDDSDEACMVQCSQEIEAKLISEAQGTMGVKTNAKLCPNGESSYSRIYDERGKKSEDQIPASQIPDDSFDDCLAFCTEDDELLGKFFKDDDKKRDLIFDKLREGAARNQASNSKVSDKTNSRQVLPANNQTFDSNSNATRKPQFTITEGAQNRKFFKEKSLSDSVFDKSVGGKGGKSNTYYGKYQGPISKSTSNCNLSDSRRKSNNSVSAVGVRNNPTFNNNVGQQPQINKNANWSYRRNSGGNGAANTTSGNADKNCRLGDNEKPRDNNQGNNLPANFQTRCTPEEIERKRLEARMRLEANRRKKLNSSRSNIQNFGIQRPGVKR